MPKYLVEMHDGRKFHVEADSQPSEADVLARLSNSSTPWVPDSPLNHRLNEQEGRGDWGQNLAAALEPMAHPKTLSDVAGLILAPVDATRASAGALIGNGLRAIAPKVGPALSATGRGLETVGETAKFPSTFAGATRIFTHPMEGAAEIVGPYVAKAAGRLMQRAGSALTPASEAVSAAPIAVPEAPLSDIDLVRREVAAGRLPRAVLDRLETVASAAPTPAPGLRPVAPSRPPVSVAPESAMPPPSPMQPPRVQVGAEAVGRQNGMSTQAVRNATGPIRGEAPGQAAGMPSQPMDRIVQKLIDMGPKGQGLPESARESYAAAATSDKGRLQVQAYLDALRKVGYVVPVAAAPSMRDLMLHGLGGGDRP